MPKSLTTGTSACCSCWMALNEDKRLGGLEPTVPPQATGGGDTLSVLRLLLSPLCMKSASDMRCRPPAAAAAAAAALGDSRAARVLAPARTAIRDAGALAQKW